MADLTFLTADSTLGLMDAKAEACHKRRVSTSLHMSQIGEECSRKLWLSLYSGFTQKTDARMIRLFQMGDIIERRVLADLKLAGVKITGRRRVFSDFNNRFRGRPDGIIEGIKESSKVHALEIKSCNDKSFKLFLKHGVKDHPSVGDKYYAQVQMMMHYSGLDRALVIVENKDNSERYQERIKFDKGRFDMLREKARLIIEAKEPPRGISDNPAWWSCKFCPLNDENWCRREWRKESNVPF